jgi:hypothetical protein
MSHNFKLRSNFSSLRIEPKIVNPVAYPLIIRIQLTSLLGYGVRDRMRVVDEKINT